MRASNICELVGRVWNLKKSYKFMYLKHVESFEIVGGTKVAISGYSSDMSEMVRFQVSTLDADLGKIPIAEFLEQIFEKMDLDLSVTDEPTHFCTYKPQKYIRYYKSIKG